MLVQKPISSGARHLHLLPAVPRGGYVPVPVSPRIFRPNGPTGPPAAGQKSPKSGRLLANAASATVECRSSRPLDRWKAHRFPPAGPSAWSAVQFNWFLSRRLPATSLARLPPFGREAAG